MASGQQPSSGSTLTQPMASLFITILILSLVSPLNFAQGQQVGPPPQPSSPCPRAIRINTNHQFRNSLHFICLQATNSRPRLEVVQYNPRQLILSKPVEENGVDQLASFVDDDGNLRILLAVPDRINGTSVYSIDRWGKPINETHTINTQFVNSLSIWKLELNWEWQLAIANQPTLEPIIGDRAPQNVRQPLPELRPMITIHSWRSSYFDSYQEITLPQDGRVKKIEPMHVNGQEFLIVAMEPQRYQRHSGLAPVKSLIYKLDFSDGALDWTHFQDLNTASALDVKTFAITHQGSLQRDYYIALLGQIDGNSRENQQHLNGTEMHDFGLSIYKYIGNQFLLIEFKSSPSARKLDSIAYGNGDSYAIIALLPGRASPIDLLLFDGMTLRELPNPLRMLPPPPQVGTNFGIRPRRTMDQQANLHLFMMPSAPFGDTDTGENTTVKRTLADGLLPQISLPAITLSEPNIDPEADLDSDNQTIDQYQIKPVYTIPIEELLKEESNSPQVNYSKRDSVGPDLLNWCKTKISSLLSDGFDNIANKLRSLPRIDQNRPIELRGDLIVENDLHVSNLLLVKQVEESSVRSGPNIVIGKSPSNYSHIFDQIRRTHIEIDNVRRRVNQILVDDGSNQEIFNTMNFDTLIIECLDSDPRMRPFMNPICPHIDEIRTDRLNARDIRNLTTQALLTGRSMTIARDVRFEHLVLHGSTQILDTLNGIPIHEIVFKRGPFSYGPIVGHKVFPMGLFSSSRLLVDYWNDHRVDRMNYLTSLGDQRIEADLRFTQVVIDSNNIKNNSSRIEKLNGLHLDTHLDQIALADDGNSFSIPVHFDELILNGPTHLKGNSLLSSIQLEHLWQHAMFKHSNQNVSAPMTFAGDVHVSYGGDIIVGRSVNGVTMNASNIVMIDRDYVFNNPVVFEQDVSVRDLQLGKALNGIQVAYNPYSRRHELAVLYNVGNQLVTGDKVFGEVYLGGHSRISGNINGHLNLTHLYALANNNGDQFRFSTVRLSGKDIQFADKVNMHIVSTINGLPTDDICHLANRIARAPDTRYNRLRFDQPVYFKFLRCASINGFNNLTNSFLTRHGDQYVAGNLRLANGVIFNSTLNIRSTFNDLNAAPLARAVSQAVNETRTGHKDHYGDFDVEDLFAERINDLRLSNVLLTKGDSPQIVRAPMTFDYLDIENVLIVGENLVTRSFNGLNITDLISNTLQYDSPQVIYNHVELNTLHLLAGSNLLTQVVNGQDLRRIYADSVLMDVPQQILAPKTFRSPVEFTNRLSLRHGIDGISSEELRSNILLHSDELIEGDLEFNNDVVIKKELEVQSGIINDIDINRFVESMLSERSDRNKLRIMGNGTVTFKDVKLNNLAVAGTIQGLDLSREAILKADNRNGTYNSKLREMQIIQNNQRLIDSRYGPGSSIPVRAQLLGAPHQGTCYVHSCSRTTLAPTLYSHPPQSYSYPTTTPAPFIDLPRPVMQSVPMGQQPGRQQPIAIPWSMAQHNNTKFVVSPPPHPHSNHYFAPPPIKFMQQFYPNIMPRPMNLVHNTSQTVPTWRPDWSQVVAGPTVMLVPVNNQTDHRVMAEIPQPNTQLIDPNYFEHNSLIQAQAIRELANRVNKHLSVSFFYEIVQKHPLLGPLLHAANNPILDEEGSALLLLKGTSKIGEPCLKRGQTVALMAQLRQRGTPGPFTQSSRIQETSNPAIIKSVAVDRNHYLFILDSFPDTASTGMVSQIIVYLWDYNSGMYQLRERIVVDGSPTEMNAFRVNDLACIALANPRVLMANISGPPVLYCQQAPKSDFGSRKLIIPISNVFDLDIVTSPRGMQIVIAALSQHNTEQIGDLTVASYDIVSAQISSVAERRMVKPLKLRFIRNSATIQLVVSEAITSSDDTQAITRIFALRFQAPAGRMVASTIRFHQSQLFRDNQFYDIQTALLDSRHSLLFLQSAHSISIYGPSSDAIESGIDCDVQYSLVQRLPTKGSNKFLVYNDHSRLSAENNTSNAPFGHFLVLSKEDCEQQQYATIILRAKFK